MDHNQLGVQLANTFLMNTQLLEQRNVRKVDVVVRNFIVCSLAVVENQFSIIRLEQVSVALPLYTNVILSRLIGLWHLLESIDLLFLKYKIFWLEMAVLPPMEAPWQTMVWLIFSVAWDFGFSSTLVYYMYLAAVKAQFLESQYLEVFSCISWMHDKRETFYQRYLWRNQDLKNNVNPPQYFH